MRYRATVIPLYEGHRQAGKAFLGYTNASSGLQAERFLRIRYPYPEYVVENIVEDPVGGQKGNPTMNSGLSQLRGELVRLKTDLEEAVADGAANQNVLQLEETYRSNIEAALGQMRFCRFKEALNHYDVVQVISGLLNQAPVQERLIRLSDMFPDLLADIASEHCNCQFLNSSSQEKAE